MLSGAATGASAQTETPGGPPATQGGPFSGLFRGSPQSQPQILDVTGAAFGGWDDNPLAQGPNGNGGLNTGVPASAVSPGITGALQGSIMYALHTSGTRNQLTVNANGSFQDFGTSSTHLFFQSYNAGASFRTKLTNKVSLSFGGGEAYAPYYQYATFLKNTASDESPVGADYGYAVNSQWVRSTTATASIDDQFTKRSSMVLMTSFSQAALASEDLTTDTGMALMRFNHNLTRKLSFHVGYGYEESEYISPNQPVTPYRSGFMDIGLGYGDGLVLHFARYYTLTLNIGASVVKNGEPAMVVRNAQNTALVVNGSALLSRSIGRSWAASAGYTRGTNYTVGIPQPLDMDSANAGIGGPLGKRVFFSAGGGASRGTMVFSPGEIGRAHV